MAAAMTRDLDTSAKGRRLALFIAGVGVFWILVNLIGKEYDWSPHTSLLFDLFALVGFGVGLVKGVILWRQRREDKD
jgi:hypothetical protein